MITLDAPGAVTLTPLLLARAADRHTKLLQDARRRLATVCKPSRPLRVHVGASWQEAALHGRRDRATTRVASRPEPRLASAPRGSLPPRAPAAGARPQPALPARALHELDADPAGFAWIDCADWAQSVVSFVRRARAAGDFVLVV